MLRLSPILLNSLRFRLLIGILAYPETILERHHATRPLQCGYKFRMHYVYNPSGLSEADPGTTLSQDSLSWQSYWPKVYLAARGSDVSRIGMMIKAGLHTICVL